MGVFILFVLFPTLLLVCVLGVIEPIHPPFFTSGSIPKEAGDFFGFASSFFWAFLGLLTSFGQCLQQLY